MPTARVLSVALLSLLVLLGGDDPVAHAAAPSKKLTRADRASLRAWVKLSDNYHRALGKADDRARTDDNAAHDACFADSYDSSTLPAPAPAGHYDRVLRLSESHYEARHRQRSARLADRYRVKLNRLRFRNLALRRLRSSTLVALRRSHAYDGIRVWPSLCGALEAYVAGGFKAMPTGHALARQPFAGRASAFQRQLRLVERHWRRAAPLMRRAGFGQRAQLLLWLE